MSDTDKLTEIRGKIIRELNIVRHLPDQDMNESLNVILDLFISLVPEEKNAIIYGDNPTSTDIGKSNFYSGYNALRSIILSNIKGLRGGNGKA